MTQEAAVDRRAMQLVAAEIAYVPLTIKTGDRVAIQWFTRCDRCLSSESAQAMVGTAKEMCR